MFSNLKDAAKSARNKLVDAVSDIDLGERAGGIRGKVVSAVEGVPATARARLVHPADAFDKGLDAVLAQSGSSAVQAAVRRARADNPYR